VNILLTGSEGFIGSHLKKFLIKEGHSVLGYDNKINKPVEELFTKLDEFWRQIDYVIHLAAHAGVRKSIEQPEHYWHNNAELSKRLFDKCWDFGIPILYASSSTAKNWWLCPYGASKKATELVAHEGQIGLRFSTVYGDGARQDMFIAKCKNRSLEYVTTQRRDWIHIDDVVSAIDHIMSYHTDGPEIYDVGLGNLYNVKDIGNMCCPGVEVKEALPCEQENNKADNLPLIRLGWKPNKSLFEYLEIPND